MEDTSIWKGLQRVHLCGRGIRVEFRSKVGIQSLKDLLKSNKIYPYSNIVSFPLD